MGYKFLKVATFYNEYLQLFYRKNQHVKQMPYNQQYKTLMQDFFSWSDSYEYYLSQLGYQTHQIIANAFSLQEQWAKENNTNKKAKELVLEQIKAIQPEILFIQDPSYFSKDFLHQIKKEVSSIKLVMAYRCAPSVEKELDVYSVCDVVLTCSCEIVQYLKNKNIDAMMLPHAFDKRILQFIDTSNKKEKLVFAGSFVLSGGYHNKRKEFFDALMRDDDIPLKVYSKVYENAKFGLEYYQTLASASIGLNYHIDFSGNIAGNIRMFEITGVGSCLLTDMKSNLGEIFDIDTEIVAYENIEDAKEKIHYLLNNPKVLDDIAKKGQERTLREYSFEKRAMLLDEIIRKKIGY